MKINSLVLYKNRPGRVLRLGKKIEIETAAGKLSVRPKDVTLLHEGPLSSLGQLRQVEGDVTTAWELLQGATTDMAELTDLIFGEFTPLAAWNMWQAVMDGLYFTTDGDSIMVRTAAEVEAITRARQAKSAEKEAWDTFLERAAKATFAQEDARYLNEVAALALGQQQRSKVLRGLAEPETQEGAHAYLLRLGYWDETVNPYPSRMGMQLDDPTMTVPALAAETRRDLTHLPAYAIDDEGNQDPDDAISWEGGAFPDGRLWIHVADAAALIRPDSEEDLEARARGANLYLPEKIVHMLPPAVTPLLGLGLAPLSPALSLAVTLDATGEITDVEIVPSQVKVTRLSYETAETQLHEPEYQQLLQATEVFASRRVAQGAVEIDLPEVRVQLLEGAVIIRPLAILRSREMVRNAMLIAGEAVGKFALQNQLPLPFSTQPAPQPIADLPDGLAGHFAMRKSMQRSQRSSTPGAHAGLGLPVYVQATSPLRRYLDLVVHQQLRAFIAGEPLLDGQAMMDRVGAAGAISGAVRNAERLSIGHWTMVYLQRRSGLQLPGVVVDKKRKRDVVLIPQLAWDVSVYARGDRPLNSKVTLELQGVDLPSRTANFRYVSEKDRRNT